MSVFELSWRGGATASRLHARRPGIDDLPWGTLALERYPDAHGRAKPEARVAPRREADVIEARRIWSNGVFTEYASAAAFSAMTGAFLECGAPIDLVAMAADIVVDEMFHVELSARLTMELGGATPVEFDLANVSPLHTGARPLLRAAELAVTTSCVSESLSVPAMARSRVLATEPLIHGVLDRLLIDEGPHARLGFWFLDWAAEQLTDLERAHLANLAVETIEVYAPLWQDADCGTCPLPVGLGGHDAKGKEALRAAVGKSIAQPLARYGIELSADRVAQLAA